MKHSKSVILAGLLVGCGGSIDGATAEADWLAPDESPTAPDQPAPPPPDGGRAAEGGRVADTTPPLVTPPLVMPAPAPVAGPDGQSIAKAGGCAPAPRSSKVVSVRDHGARGDGVTDDTSAIQRAIDAVAGSGGTVLVPDGTYLVDAVHVSSSYGLRLKSDMTFRMTASAVLKVKPNSAGSYRVILIRQAKDVTVVGGTILGERDQHLGTSGEWGMGIGVAGSQNVVLDGVTVKGSWGDGLYVTSENQVRTSQLTICRTVFDGNRRQGISIIDVDGAVIRDSALINTTGTSPADGIDIEPNLGDVVENVQITRCLIRGNQGHGIQSAVPGRHLGMSFVRNITMEGNLIADNLKSGILLNAGPQVIKGNLIERNARDGIAVRTSAHDIIVTGNTVRSNTAHGIYDTSSLRASNTIKDNLVTGNGLKP